MIRGSILFRERRPEKSLTVMPFTMASANTTSSKPPSPDISKETFWAGGQMFTTAMIMMPAMMPVTTNTSSIFPRILPRRFRFTMEPTAVTTLVNTRGTTTVNIRFRNTWPKGLRTVAFSPIAQPNRQPTTMEPMSNSGKR